MYHNIILIYNGDGIAKAIDPISESISCILVEGITKKTLFEKNNILVLHSIINDTKD